VGLVALVAGQIVNLMTLAAEVGGVALVLHLASDLSYRALIVVALVLLLLVLWVMPFGWIERVFGYLGLALLVFVVAAIKLNPDWGAVANGFVPSAGTGNGYVYAYFVVGLIGAAMIPYEVYFYSSGAIEERWGPQDLGVNRANAVVGYCLGGLLSFALMISAGALLLPRGISADLLGTVALVAQSPVGQAGLVLALVGMFFAISGAAIDSAFSGAYNLAQFFGWEWGKYRHNAGAPRFTITWIVMLVLAFLIVMSGVDPIMVTELSVISAVVALPLTYLPILLVANDRAYMGTHANGVVGNIFGIFYLVVIVVIAIAAVPLLVLSNMGQG
jgi:manganese transport protein